MPIMVSGKVERKIAATLGRDSRAVVVLGKGGRLSVYSLARYLVRKERMREVIYGHKPWLARKGSVMGPLGTKPLGIKGGLSRREIYEGR